MLDSIQYLRAIAAWLVVLYHVYASLARETGTAPVFTAGAIGVDIFFVLSGFLMTMVVDRGETMDRRFLLRRWFRIAPLYYLMTLALFVIALVEPHLLYSATADPLRLLHSVLFLPGSEASGGAQPILALGWTLNYEMAFYLLVFIFVRWGGDNRLFGLTAFLVFLVLLGQVVDNPGTVLRFYTDPIVLEFAMGIVLYNTIFRRRPARFSAGVAWLAILSGALLFALQIRSEPEACRFLVWGVPAALIVAGGVHGFTARIGWLGRLGDWSYSTYLLHVYVIQAGVKLVLPALGLSSAPPLAVFLLTAPLIALGSFLLFRGVEMPVMRRFGRSVAR